MVVYVNQPIDWQAHVIEQCPLLKESAADIDAVSTYPTFDFQVSIFMFNLFVNKNVHYNTFVNNDSSNDL